MNFKKPMPRRALSMLLAFALVLPAFLTLVGKSGSAEAAISLPHIEKLKQAGGIFKILEIAPNADEGSLGYYIPGQEPSTRQMARAGNKTQEERKAAANELIKGLDDKKLRGGGENFPLAPNGGYKEFFPWEASPAGALMLPLDHPEETTVNGTFSEQSNGAFVQNKLFSLQQGGNYVQVVTAIKKDSKDTAVQDRYYYKKLSYTLLKKEEELKNHTLIYAVIPDEDKTTAPDLTIADGAPKNLKCVGVVGSASFPGLNLNETHYAVVPSDPVKDWDSNHSFRAEGTEFREAVTGEIGYFSAKDTGYTYVGNGGTHNFIPGAGAAAKVSYSFVHFTPGYTNNDWFMKYVFDWEPANGEARPKLGFEVRTLAGNDVTPNMIASANLVVLSSGFALSGSATAFSKANDISDKAKEAILAAGKPKVGRGAPIIVDGNLKNAANTNIKTAAEALIAGETAPSFVKNNIFCSDQPLAIKSFKNSYPPDTEKAFAQVLSEIKRENDIRAIDGIAKLSEEVTMARAIRAIISYSGRDAAKEKSTIKVLEIQPGKLGELTPAKVHGWLGKPPGSTTPEVSITVLSTSELIGKIENIIEEYDLVYIGANVNGMSTDYNDNNMDGLIYTNIGDTVVSGGTSGFSMSGLLDRDYCYEGCGCDKPTFTENRAQYNSLHTGYWENGSHYNDKTRTFRYSGNDLTPGKMQELMSYANAGYPIVLEDSLTDKEPINTAGKVNGNVELKVSLLPCKYGTQMELDTASNTLTISILTNALDGSLDGSVGKVKSADCQLYNANGEKVFEPQTISADSPAQFKNITDGTYYAMITATKISWSTLDGEYTIVSQTPARTGRVFVGKGINPSRVDNSSYMYELLNTTLEKPNVMTAGEADSKSADLGLYVNLSKPKLEFSEYPTPYKKDDKDGTVTSLSKGADGYYLDYRFKITNATDPDPANTRYTAKLYIDSNADGRYRDDEQLSDVIVRVWNNNAAGAAVSELELDKEYCISQKLPPEKVGIIPWKLEVLKTGAGNETICASYNNYTHVPTEENKQVTLKILQINTSRKDSSGKYMPGIDLAAQMKEKGEDVSSPYYSAVTKKSYAGIYGKLLADISKDYRVNITTIRSDLADAIKFSTFDMLIIGFDDCYRELSQEVAEKLAEYIKSGKATLFTHDTTSFFFLPFEKYPTGNGVKKTPTYAYANNKNDFTDTFGYYFNTKLRSAVGLDRYGISDSNYGVTKNAPTYLRGSAWTGITASDNYLKLMEEEAETEAEKQKNKLTSAGYSIAYKPNSGRNQTVAETQGLTKGTLMRFYKSGGKPPFGTYATGNADNLEIQSSISQVNEGQITTYPFDVNTELFKPNAAANAKNFMPIAQTHCQYQQLNMNSDDVVVWYCLSGSKFDNLPNDVVNSYYIYSKGNVTYSGAGHTTDPAEVNKNVEEAKLFVNTMIAAYRVADIKPEISFTDATGKIPLDNFMVPADSVGVLKPKTGDIPRENYMAYNNSVGTLNTDRNIYFTINDANLKNKKLSVEFKSGDTVLPLPVYEADTNLEVGKEAAGKKPEFTSGLTYYIKLDDITADIADGGTPITATLTSEIESVKKTGTDTLTLRKFQLFKLS